MGPSCNKLLRRRRVPICGWLRSSYYPGISPEVLADIWQETLTELLKEVQAKKYDGSRKVFGDLCRIIKTNAIDQRRRHKARDNLLHAIAMVLKGTQTGRNGSRRIRASGTRSSN